MNNRENKHFVKVSEVKEYLGMTDEEEKKIAEIAEKYPLSVPEYYLSLVNPEDPADPIRRMCIPTLGEDGREGTFDTSGEADNTVEIGVQHKYRQTALILSTNCCAMYCRHCFRKRMIGVSDREIVRNCEKAIAYISEHKEISNVLISGGDSFMLPNGMIERYLEAFTQMPHLDLIRFGTRIPVVDPNRILGDEELQGIFRRYAGKKQIYIVTQFNHPRELTEQSCRVIRCFSEMGIVVKNQTVLLRGVNDNPEVLGELLKKLVAAGTVPYYIFQCRPVKGVKSQFQVPLEEGIEIVDQAKNMQNGQAKCVRYCMSTPKGKVEVIGKLPNQEAVFKFHQAKNPKDASRVFTVKLDKGQTWLDL